MSKNMNAMNLNNKKGASVTEFLVAAPVLAILLYAALDLNQLIEFRQGLIVATRNAAFNTLGGQVLDTGTNSSVAQQVKPFATPGAESDMGSLTVTSVEKLGYSGDLGYAPDRAKAALTGAGRGDDGTFETISSTAGSVVVTANNGLDKLTKFINLNGLTDNVWLLPPAKLRAVTGQLAETGGSSALRKSFTLVAKTAENLDNGSSAPTLKSPSSSHLFYIRPENGYHPDGYVAQPLIGYLLGSATDYKEWGATGRVNIGAKPKNYNHNCLMNFDGGSDHCTGMNGAFSTIKGLGVAIRLLIIAGEASVFLTLPAAAIDVKTMVIKAAADFAVGELTNFVADNVKDEIGRSAEKALKDVDFSDGIPGAGSLSDPAAFLNPTGLVIDGFSDLSVFDQLTTFKLPNQ